MKKDKVLDCIFFILIFVFILSIVLVKPLGDLDELWNYNFAKNVSKGLIPYRDFNMVPTPLLSIICGIILKLTFDSLITMRIIATIICTFIFLLVYKLFIFLDLDRKVASILTCIICYIMHTTFCVDYNWFTLLVTLSIIILEIKEIDKNNISHNIVLGLLAGICITIKQTSRIFYCYSMLRI